MKSVQGLLIAVALGLAGAVLNWFYLEQRSHDFEKVSFIGVKAETDVRQGQPLREDQLLRVDIPRNAVGNLKDAAFFWKDLATVVGQSSTREYTGGELLLRQDLKTPSRELDLRGAGQVAIPIPIDAGLMVPSLIMPGQMVSFIVTRPAAQRQPTPAVEGSDGSELAPIPDPTSRPSGSEIIGPFRVLSLGNRLGSLEVMKANHIGVQNENVMMIAVKMQGDALEPKAARLWELLRQTNFRQVGVILHPRVDQAE